MLSCSLLAIALAGGILTFCNPSRPAGSASAQIRPDRCIVSAIADGDSFRCRDGRRVRLIGIDSPEGQQGEAGVLARRALGRLLPRNKSVRLEGDAAPTDRYGRVLAYVWVGSTLVNDAMVRQGWALLFTVPPNVKYADRLAEAQNEARAAKAGLWANGEFDCPPSQFRRNRCATPP